VGDAKNRVDGIRIGGLVDPSSAHFLTPLSPKITPLHVPFTIFKPDLSVVVGIKSAGRSQIHLEGEICLVPGCHILTIASSQKTVELLISGLEFDGNAANFNYYLVPGVIDGPSHP
jgi:hypothetical protein